MMKLTTITALLCLLSRSSVVHSFGVVSPVVEAWDSYNAALAAHPLAVKSVTASVILGAADLSGQALEASKQQQDEEETSIDWARAARFSVFGLVLQAVSQGRKEGRKDAIHKMLLYHASICPDKPP
eukprot:scaffold15248_cov146-Amphora_coffeaeformis.AAC.3